MFRTVPVGLLFGTKPSRRVIRLRNIHSPLYSENAPNNLVPPPEDEIDTRRVASRSWYFANRDNMLTSLYFYKFVLIDNGKVIATFQDLPTASRYQQDHPWLFLTRVGDEEYGKRVISGKQNLAGRPATLLFPWEVPPELFCTPISKEEYHKIPAKDKFMFYSDICRLYVLLGISSPRNTGVVIPSWFLLDTGAPKTSLEESTAAVVFGRIPTEPEFRLYLHDANKSIVSELSCAHYFNVNLLGTDVLWNCASALSIRYPTSAVIDF